MIFGLEKYPQRNLYTRDKYECLGTQITKVTRDYKYKGHDGTAPFSDMQNRYSMHKLQPYGHKRALLEDH